MPRKATRPKTRKFKPMEICEIGEKIYQESLKKKLEPRLNGRYIVIDIITKKYVIGEDQYANHKLSLQLFGSDPRYGRKIGPDPYGVRFG